MKAPGLNRARRSAYLARRGVRLQVKRTGDALDTDHLWRWITAPLRTRPDFLILGAQKSGTTALAGLLAAHPQVRPARVKELHYLNSTPVPSRLDYRAHFPLATPGRRWLTYEATPAYLFHPGAPWRAAAVVPPTTRFIVLLRNPIDRAVSQVRMGHRRGWEDLDVLDALAAEDQRAERLALQGRTAWDTAGGGTWGLYRARGMYADQLERWFEVFPRHQFLILRTEDMAADTQATFDRVCDFLQIARQDLGPIEAPASATLVDEEVRAFLAPHYEDPNRRLAALTGITWNSETVAPHSPQPPRPVGNPCP